MHKVKLVIIICTAILLIVFTCTKNQKDSKIAEIKDSSIKDSLIEDSIEYDISMYEEHLYKLVHAFAIVESNCNPNAINNNAVGYLQITPVCVKQANKIIGFNMYNLNDRNYILGSVAIFNTIMQEKNPTLNIKKACEIWNPNAGEWYYNKVKANYDKINFEDIKTIYGL